jgi:hypothetical protein
MIFLCNQRLPGIIMQAAFIANDFFNHVRYEDLVKLEPFNYTNLGAFEIDAEISRMVNGLNVHITPPYNILPWWPKYRPTKAVATTFGDGNIHINMYRVSETKKEIIGHKEVLVRNWLGKKVVKKIPIYGEVSMLPCYVNTLAHEVMHNLGYSHGNNYVTQKKLRSIPFAIGSMAEAFAGYEK